MFFVWFDYKFLDFCKIRISNVFIIKFITAFYNCLLLKKELITVERASVPLFHSNKLPKMFATFPIGRFQIVFNSDECLSHFF